MKEGNFWEAKEKMKKETKFKLEIIFFVVLLFLQNFALIRTVDFGIAALTIYVIYLFIKYKLYMKIEKRFFCFLIILYGVIVVSAVVNQSINVLQIARLTMIIFVGWTVYQYSDIIQEKGETNFFYKIFKKGLIVIMIYGIYQLIASVKGWPIFLNIFNNNPSYSIKGIYQVYGGWNESARIYATFYEPSAYAIFLVNAYFFVVDNKLIGTKQKIIVTILAIINIIFTYSRSGWITFIYFIAILLFFKIIKKENWIKLIGKFLIVLLPLISLWIMSIIGLKIFDDHSSKVRTYSSLYYLENTFDNLKSVVVGHGLGSIYNIEDGTMYNDYEIEQFTHNGYIDIMYQLGVVYFILLIYTICKSFKNKNMQNEWIVYASVFTLTCFGTMFNVESLIALVSLILGFTKFKIINGGNEIGGE